MRILIAGAGRAGLSVAAHLLEAGHQVIVSDREQGLARRAAEQHGLVTLVGDATETETLTGAEAGRADVAVAMLRRDADNLAFSLLARLAGARTVMARMRDAAYRPVYVAAGVSRVLSEIDMFIGAFGTAIEHNEIRQALVVGDGQSIAFEMTVPPKALVVGQTIAKISAHPDFPDDCVVAGLFVAGKPVSKVRGGSVIEAGMGVLLVTPRAGISAALRFFVRPG